MKALEILQEGLNFMEKAIETNPLSKEELESEIKIYQEAIKELEAIQDIILEKEEALEIERFLHKKKIEALQQRILHLETIEADLIMKENRNCNNCKFVKIDDFDNIYCNVFQCYQRKALKYCGNWESK